MLPALTLVVACYTFTRFVEMLSAKDTRVVVRIVAGFMLALSFVSCSVVTFGAASDELDAARARRGVVR
jgi:hypothetical protein